MSRTKALAITAGTLAAGAMLATGITGIANAADTTPRPSSTASAAPSTGDHGPHGHGGPAGPGPRGEMGSQALHSEAVVKSADGTISTVVSIRGSVTAGSSTSISVNAEDGFTATYTVNADTKVRTGVPTRPVAGSTATLTDAGTIADVKVGDVAHVDGTVTGSTSVASSIHAMTAAEAAQTH